MLCILRSQRRKLKHSLFQGNPGVSLHTAILLSNVFLDWTGDISLWKSRRETLAITNLTPVILNLQLGFLLIYRIQKDSVLSVHELWDRIVRFFQWPKLQQTTLLCSEGFCNIKDASHYLNTMSNYGIKSHNFGICSSHINPPQPTQHPAYPTAALPAWMLSASHLKLRADFKHSQAWLVKHVLFSDVLFAVFIQCDLNGTLIFQLEGK